MKNQVKIPVPFILEMDDVGWIDGRDYSDQGRASRSGLNRNHCFKDYEFLKELTKRTGKHIAAALVVGDWDKDNFLRGKEGFTHDPENWDQKSIIDVDEHRKCLALLERSNVDYMIHGVLHGRYDEFGKCITECEYLLTRKNENGSYERYLPSEEDLRRRLDMFFKIYNAWGLKQKVRGFAVPCGARFATEETVKRICKVLSEYGIRYWADSFSYPEFDSNLKVYSGVACFRWKGNPVNMPWDKASIDPSSLVVLNKEDSLKITCLHGSHWTNFLNIDPDRNIDNLDGWVDFLDRQSEVFGSVNAENLASAVNQLFYYEYSKSFWEGNTLTINLSDVLYQALDFHNNEFFISVKKDTTPKNCDGGNIFLYEEKRDFVTFKVVHEGDKVQITF